MKIPMRRTKAVTALASGPYSPPVIQAGPTVLLWMTGEYSVIPLTGSPKRRHILAFQAKCQPQQTQRARVRKYATDRSQLLKTVTTKLARLAPGLNMCKAAKTSEETIVAKVGPTASIK